jgi:hypothetical protein
MPRNKLDDKKMMEIYDQRNAEAMEKLKNMPSAAMDAIMGVFSSGAPESAIPQDVTTKAKMGSYFGPGNSAPLGEIDTGGMSTEEVQKLQAEDKAKRQALQDVITRQQMQEPPMQVPKARNPVDMDPRLADPQNRAKFEAYLEQIKKK